MEHQSAQMLQLKRFLQYGSEVDGPEAEFVAASQPSNSAAQLSSQSLDFLSAGELAFVQQHHQDSEHAGGSALSPSLSLSLTAGLPSQQQQQQQKQQAQAQHQQAQHQQASLLRSRSESQARIGGGMNNAAGGQPQDHFQRRQLTPQKHMQPHPTPNDQRTIYTGRVQATPISVLCEAPDCGALLEVNVPLSRRTGTVCIRCGNCSKLLEVDFNEETRPPPSTPPAEDAFKSMSGLAAPKAKPGKKLGQSENDGYKQPAKKSREPKGSVLQRPRAPPTSVVAKSPGVRKRELAIRGPSKYNIFIKSEIPRLKEANPNMTHKAAFSIAAKNWKTCPWNPHGHRENGVTGDDLHTNGREFSSEETSLLNHVGPTDGLDKVIDAGDGISQEERETLNELQDSQGLPDVEELDDMEEREEHCPTPLSHADLKAACDLATGVGLHTLDD